MRTTTLLFGALASAALAGCGTMGTWGLTVALPGRARRQLATNSAICRIDVSVSGCTVTIPPDKQVIEMNGRNVVIIWRLDAAAVKAKFEFDATAGVVLKDPTSDPDGQFFGQMAIDNKTGYLWIDTELELVAKYYEYKINLWDTVNNRPCTLDPMFFNN